MDDKLTRALDFFLLVLDVVPDRIVPIRRRTGPPLIIYTDASTQPWGLRLGAVITEADGPTDVASWDVPAEVVDKWRFRSQYIGQGELLCGPLILSLFEDRLRGRQVIWFVDNVAAATAMTKTCSPTEDCSAMTLLVALQSGLWLEYVHTKQNPADWPSRGGLADPEVRRRLQDGSWQAADLPPVDWEPLLNTDLAAAFAAVTTLGQ